MSGGVMRKANAGHRKAGYVISEQPGGAELEMSAHFRTARHSILDKTTGLLFTGLLRPAVPRAGMCSLDETTISNISETLMCT